MSPAVPCFRRAAVLFPLVAALAAPALAQSTSRVSISSAGVHGNNQSVAPAISADGRYVAFGSFAHTLVAGDTNGLPDIFVHDRQTATTTRVSVGAGGAQSNGESRQPSISADGRFVTFESLADNLVGGDTNGFFDVFVHDRQTATTSRVSVGLGGAQSDGGSAQGLNMFGHAISADGRYIAFVSSATNLVAGDTNGSADAFVYDRIGATTTRVSVSTGGAQATATTTRCAISQDGRYVAMETGAPLGPGDTGMIDVYVHDRQTVTTTRASVSSAGVQANFDCRFPSISSDGRYVAFISQASNLATGDTNGKTDTFLHDLQTGVTERVSVATSGAQGNDDVGAYTSVSANGRYVVFDTESTNLVPGDTNAAIDVVLRDRLVGVTSCVSVDLTGTPGNQLSASGPITPDGRYVAFFSAATDLIASDTNGVVDAFVRDRGLALTGTPFCFGDGFGTACPCANNGTLPAGCASSGFASGALLQANGSARVTADGVVLGASNMTGSVAVFFQGATTTAPTVIDDGLGCVGGPIIRLGTKPVVSAASSYPQAGDALVSVRGSIPAAGGTFYYQCFYRNAVAAFCPPATSNRTNAVAIAWQP